MKKEVYIILVGLILIIGVLIIGFKMTMNYYENNECLSQKMNCIHWIRTTGENINCEQEYKNCEYIRKGLD